MTDRHENGNLTARQLEAIKLLADGKDTRLAGDILGISHSGVSRLLERAKDHTGACNNTSLACMAIRKGWIE